MHSKCLALFALALLVILVIACAPAPTPAPTAAPPTAAPAAKPTEAAKAATALAATAAPKPTEVPKPTEAPKVVKGDLNVLCVVNEDPCVGLKKEFDAKFPSINMNYVRLSAGEALTRMRNEKVNPQFDIIYGGPVDTYISAKKEGLLEPYKSANQANVIDPKLMLDSDAIPQWAGIYVGTLGFGTNENYLKKNPNFKAPTSYEDLLKPEMKGQIIIAHPASSGTSYTFMCTILQLKGEKAGWEYMAKFSQNVSTWTKSGNAPVQSVGSGEGAVGVVFSHDILAGIESGQPLQLTFPTEGDGYEIGGMALIKGAKNLEPAKVMYDWALTPSQQENGAKYKMLQGPTIKGAKAARPELLTVKLMNYDFAYCGDNKKAFTDKFSNEIAALSLAK